MVEKATIARPYARAAFASARLANTLAAWSNALQTASVVVSDARVRNLIGNPQVPVEQLINLIGEAIGVTNGGKLDVNVTNFLEELARNRRLAMLPEVAAMFEAMRNEFENVADVQITSAVALNEVQRQRFVASLKKRLQKDVRLHCDVDASLMGGAVIRADDLVIDGSLRARLQALSNAMTH